MNNLSDDLEPMTAPPGGPCGWAYCTKWGSLMVEPPPGLDLEPILVCLTHLVHARMKGYEVAEAERR